MDNSSSIPFSSYPLQFSQTLPTKHDEAFRRVDVTIAGISASGIILRVVLLFIPFILTYLFTYTTAIAAINSKVKGRKVPTSPYWVPFLGHVFEFLWSTASLSHIARRSFPQGPLGVRLGTQKIIFVTGSENIVKIWRSKVLQAREVNYMALRQFFGLPKRAERLYVTDTSGFHREPIPGTNIIHKNRYYYHNRKTVAGFFKGPELKQMVHQFQDLLYAEALKQNIVQEWQEMADLYTFIQHLVTGPAVEAMCGPRLREKNPHFVDQFWKLDSDIFFFFKMVPKFLIPSAWDNRAKLLASVKEWHTYAGASYQESDINASGHDPYYGSPLMRRRQETLSQIDGMDANALASEDLGLLWAENGNSIPAIFWMLVEMIKRPEALEECMKEVHDTLSAAEIKAGDTIDVDSLGRKPMIQSAYAETLRLYTSLFALRSPVHEDFWLDDWHIPRNQMIAIDSRVAHLDATVWNSKVTSKHVANTDIKEFCPHRFLRYADEGTKGLTDSLLKDGQVDNQNLDSTRTHFSVEGLSGAWLPYGGGNKQCPGKNFAKQEILLSFAVIMTLFEIELSGKEAQEPILPNLKYYGLGTMGPIGKIPFRIRCRA